MGSPLSTPYIFAAICHTSMKLFLRNLRDIWGLCPPTLLKLGNFTSFYNRLNKKYCKNGNLCFTPYVFTGYGRFFPKKVLVNVLMLLFCQNVFFLKRSCPTSKIEILANLGLILTDFHELRLTPYFLARNKQNFPENFLVRL
jgi:hypothetical protein